MKLKDLLQEKNLDHLYSGEKELIEKSFKGVEHHLKTIAVDLGKAGYKKESIEVQRFHKKHWIEFKLKFEKMYQKVINK